MQKKTMAKLLGRIMLGCGAGLLVFTVPGSLLVPTHALFKEAARVEVSEDSPPVRDREYEGWDGFAAKEMLLSAPSVLTYRLSILSRMPTPARLYLRGGVDVQKDAELIADFGSRFDGLAMRVRVNGLESFVTYFDADHLHYRSFSVELPNSGDVVIEVEFDPGPAGNHDYDWAVLRKLRVEPSFMEAYLLAGFLLTLGIVLVRSGRRAAAKETRSVSLSTGRKLMFSVCIALVFGAVIVEAGFIKLARSSAITIRFPSLMPPGLTRYQASKDWRFDPDAGYSLLPNLDTEYEFEDGDIYYLNMTTLKRSANPVSIFHRTDQYGFRNTTKPENARIGVLGDSFTQGLNSNHPFPGLMGSFMGVPVYNLGTGGYGTLQEEASLRRMLAHLSSLEVVVLAWFVGNDIKDNERFYKARAAGELADEYDSHAHITIMDSAPARYSLFERRLFGRVMLGLVPAMERLAERFVLINIEPPSLEPSESGAEVQNVRDGPSGLTPESGETRNAFVSMKTYKEANVFVLNLRSGQTPVAFRYFPVYETAASAGMERGLASIVRIKDMLAASGQNLLVVNIPLKFVVYRDLLGESCPGAELGRRVMPIAKGWHARTPEELIDKIDKDINLNTGRLSGYCASHGVPFLDLTPGFKKKASDELLYYENDSHFNRAGNELAAHLIVEEINRLWPGRFSNSGN